MFASLLFLSIIAQALTLRVAQFNILAPCWAHPKWYEGNYAYQLETNYRRPLVRKEIATLATQNVDLFLLAETQPSEVDDLFKSGGLIKNQWHIYQVAHAPTYWSNWFITDPVEIAQAPWTSNHTDHGVAILARKSSFTGVAFSKISVETGNAQALMTATHNGKQIRVISVHYDSDSAANRKTELRASIEALPAGNFVDILGGDFNADTNSGNLQKDLLSADFIDSLTYTGVFGPTHPFSFGSYDLPKFAVIDHITTRKGIPTMPTFVRHNGLYTIYPIQPMPDPEYNRVFDNFEQVGSDHFPIFSTITV